MVEDSKLVMMIVSAVPNPETISSTCDLEKDLKLCCPSTEGLGQVEFFTTSCFLEPFPFAHFWGEFPPVFYHGATTWDTKLVQIFHQWERGVEVIKIQMITLV